MPQDSPKTARVLRGKREISAEAPDVCPTKKVRPNSPPADSSDCTVITAKTATDNVSESSTADVHDIARPKQIRDIRYKYDDCGYIPQGFITKRLDTGGRDLKNELGYYHAADLIPETRLNVSWNKNKRLLHVNGKQLVVCVMVRVMAVGFAINEDAVELPDRQWIRFRTLREIDRLALEHILYGMQNPPAAHDRRSFYAGHWTSHSKAAPSTPFKEVLDAPLFISGKQNSPLPAEALSVNDVLFLELNVRRWGLRTDKGKQTAKNPFANGWSSALDLWRIFRMFKATSATPKEPDSDNEYAGIEMDND
ncbi:hypothetical protein BDY19DRAFT_909611 [Irpex rosettiformis]|uniref:Uncharacterized protein n=1 Tax=Irpex rosettiformis TaxID=378272 RepID=A0ACB8TRT9_9APHY|nr:hypothetical protein BDY19DRAFT_909611 [Irpex rosettiformis]